MTELADQAAVAGLLERFSNFFDAVLVEVVLTLPTRSQQDRRATIKLQAQETGGPWRTVVLTVVRLREYRFAEGPRTPHLVLSDGLGIQFVDDAVFLDLAPYTDQPVPPSMLRRSHQYVVGDACRYEVADV